jgi:hypothetical protein
MRLLPTVRQVRRTSSFFGVCHTQILRMSQFVPFVNLQIGGTGKVYHVCTSVPDTLNQGPALAISILYPRVPMFMVTN